MPMANFIRDYANVLEDVETTGDTVVLERRAGKSSFVLAPLDRVQGDQHAISAVAHVLGHALDHGDMATVVVTGLAEEYPWVTFLPEAEQRTFEREVLTTLRACASIGRFTAFENLIDSWAATAEIWSDPELARALAEPIEAPHGSAVPEPVVV
ncbi:hypothetical protein GCM10027596_31630 [Nocardioides korecus]